MRSRDRHDRHIAHPTIRHLSEHIGQRVLFRGWLNNKRSSGKLAFLQLRDGSGTVQGVVSKAGVSEAAWEDSQRVTQESTVHATGVVKADTRAAGGVELQLDDFVVDHLTVDFPITPKEHGTAFLMENRHLWLRSSRQTAALRVRSEVAQAIRDFFYDRDFALIDSPILTPAACEGPRRFSRPTTSATRRICRRAASSTSSRPPRRSARCTASARLSGRRSRRPDGT
jgi:asparaginyl-tRNA synthetase